MTVLDLLKRSLRLLGVLNTGDEPTAEEQANGLVALNSFTNALALERLSMFAVVREVFHLQANQGAYTIGPTAVDWETQRPMQIDDAGVILAGTDPTNTYEKPIKVLRSMEEYARIRLKNLPSAWPLALFYDYGYSTDPNHTGNGTIAVWPVPTEFNQIALYTPQAISTFTKLTDQIALPPGYDRMLPYNLAVEWAPEFPGVTISPLVVAIAEESKEKIKRRNARPGKLRCRDRAPQAHGGSFDLFLGEPR